MRESRVEGLDIPELSSARDLLGKHAMQLRVDAVRRDRDRNEFAHGLLDRQRDRLRECRADDGGLAAGAIAIRTERSVG